AGTRRIDGQARGEGTGAGQFITAGICDAVSPAVRGSFVGTRAAGRVGAIWNRAGDFLCGAERPGTLARCGWEARGRVEAELYAVRATAREAEGLKGAGGLEVCGAGLLGSRGGNHAVGLDAGRDEFQRWYKAQLAGNGSAGPDNDCDGFLGQAAQVQFER